MKGLYDNEMKLEFTSKGSNEAFARITVAAFASSLDITIDELSDIKTAVSEAVTNSIIHGYDDENGIVTVECKIFANTLEIVVSDTGKGISDIHTAMKPLYTSKPNSERSGMGFTIMESFMDSIKVESSLGFGTRVTMTKKINEPVEVNKIEEGEEVLSSNQVNA